MTEKSKLSELLYQLTITVCLVMLPLTMLVGFKDEGNEYTIKALFIYNFTKYIEWPEQNISEHFKIGVMGEPIMNEKLAGILQGKKIYNRAFEIKTVNTIDEVAGCQILIISKNANDKLKPVIDRYSKNEILIVTEYKNMATKGAGMNLIEKDQRMKFEMNDASIKKAGLKIASQLYELAIVIK